MMKFLFSRSTDASALPILIGAQALAGLAGACILSVLTGAAGSPGHGSPWRSVLLATGVLALFVLAQRYATNRTTIRVERSIHQVRIRIMDKLARTDLQTFERIGDANLLSCVEKDMKLISNASVAILSAGQSAMLAICGVGYLAYLSPIAFLILLVVMALGLLLHVGKMRAISRGMETALQVENSMVGLIGHMVGGFKELKLHERRRREIYHDLVRTSEHVAELNEAAFARATDHLIMIQSILYVLLGAIVFGLPLFGTLQPFLIIKLVAITLFLSGPLNHFIGILPVYAQATAAARNISTLEQRLEQSQNDEDSEAAASAPEALTRIDMRGVSFSYDGADGSAFSIGPLNLTIHSGQLIFVTGGNGSGKSTFLKLLTGLLPPDRGTIQMNGRTVSAEGSASYRGLFAAIFWDYHLFPTLYGLETPNQGELQKMLRQLALDTKTRLVKRSFLSLSLSTGQRKRLAHLIALLEDRQVYIFDEWAADQDPHFRRWFYHVELPRLKALGKTIIAVTHDEQYLSVADRWVHFEEGRCVDMTPNHSAQIELATPQVLGDYQ
jgi:putative ATP-binding cassette transporter